jgi:hypothetical protein
MFLELLLSLLLRLKADENLPEDLVGFDKEDPVRDLDLLRFLTGLFWVRKDSELFAAIFLAFELMKVLF